MTAHVTQAKIEAAVRAAVAAGWPGGMAFLGHTEARTSEVYTAGARRAVLSGEAARALAGMEW